jgi:hypothetical protein
MPIRNEPSQLSRRAILGTLAGGAASLATASPAGSAEPAAGGKSRTTIRDHLWIFTVAAGCDDNWYEEGGVRGGSRMTPAEGAFYLNTPNLILVRDQDRPPLPNQEKWRAKTTFEQYALSFRPLDRVLWSVVGSGGKGGLAELGPVLQLAEKYPNIAGIYLDDFIVDTKPRNGKNIGRPALDPAELQAARQRMKSLERPMEIWVTLYSHELLPEHRQYRGCEPPLAEFLGLFDVLTLWTWWSEELRSLEQSFAALEAIAPKSARIALGMYVWDFPGKRPVPLELMKHQCELALRWIRQKQIHEIIVLGNTGLDLGLPSAEYVRDWIARVGKETIS